MKSYKESNKEIKVDELLKQHTIQKMISPVSKRSIVWKKTVMYAGMAAMLLILVGGNHLIQAPDQKGVKNNAENFTDQLSLDAYIIPSNEQQQKTGTAMDYDGIWKIMTAEEQRSYEQMFPALRELWIPDGYHISSREFQMFYEENETGYLDIHIGMRNRDGEDGMADLWIQDDRIPQCIVLKDKGKSYLDYQLLIYADASSESYTAIAYKAGYRYEISSWKISQDAFYQLVKSILI